MCSRCVRGSWSSDVGCIMSEKTYKCPKCGFEMIPEKEHIYVDSWNPTYRATACVKCNFWFDMNKTTEVAKCEM